MRPSAPSRLSALLQELARDPRERDGSGRPWPRPGATVGRFTLRREVGRGGFGVVYEAHDEEGRPVALKLVRPGRQSDGDEERLLREAELAAELSHPNIVRLLDAGRSDHGPYLVFELLRGQTLARRLSQGRVPPREAARIGVEVAKGLAAAHATGVVHRDLKPANVFVCESGEVKLLDLGLAHAFGRRREDGGTPGFMAPEQARGAPEDERTDVWALGALLHVLLSGRPPDRPLGRDPPRLMVPGAPALGTLVERMLEADPVRRPRDAGAVLPALVALQGELDRAPVADRLARARWLGGRRRRRVAAGMVAALALAAAAWWGQRLVGAAAPRPAPSIAVLPFEDLSPNRDQGYFADGLADEILSALSRLPGLRVPGRTSSFYYRGKEARLADIGRELGVVAVLEGSVRTAGARVRITARVVSVKDGLRQWSQTYDRELTDVFEVQRDIARSVAAALGVQLAGLGPADDPARVTASVAAYTEYLLGRKEQRRLRREGSARAAQAYERALQLDPAYAPAWAGLALAHYWLASWDEDAETARRTRERALAEAERAVALAPELPEALAARAAMRSAFLHDWDGAGRDLERALALNGNDPDVRRQHAIHLLELGRLPEARAEALRSIELDPLGPAWLTLGTILQDLGDLGDADAAYRRYVEIDPESLAGYVGLGRNLLLQGKASEALAAFERTGDELYRLWGRAAANHSLGKASASDEATAALVARFADVEAYEVAAARAWRGDRTAALDLIERSLARREGSVTPEIALDPVFASLRDEPRFKALAAAALAPAPGRR
jgi:serine/threonine-protein kinase